MKYKEMIYQSDRKREVLFQKNYKGYNYYILNLGTHPTAYVEIPKESKYYNVEYNNIDVYVHGGLTYSDNFLDISETERLEGWFIGWDYSHYNDYSGIYETLDEWNEWFEARYFKKWTTEEIIRDCISVIDQLEVEEDGKTK